MATHEESLADFSSLPWCRALFADPSWMSVPTLARIPPPPPPPRRRRCSSSSSFSSSIDDNDTDNKNIETNTEASTENSLFAETLWTDRTIRACQTFHQTSTLLPSSSSTSSPAAAPEVRMLLSLGDGLHGIHGISSGGFIALAVDEVMAQLVAGVLVERGREFMRTAFLKVDYKRPLGTPVVVLCRAWVVEEEKRGKSGKGKKGKVWVKGAVEDGRGGVYACGEGLFVRGKEEARL